MLNLVGGLWASDINADYGWKEWTENQNFMTDRYNDNNYFKFRLKDNARVLYLKDEKDLKNLPKNNSELTRMMKMCGTEYLDFEKLKEDYDAIEIEIDKLYWTLYGWDCDSILVMNKEVIELI